MPDTQILPWLEDMIKAAEESGKPLEKVVLAPDDWWAGITEMAVIVGRPGKTTPALIDWGNPEPNFVFLGVPVYPGDP